MKMSLSEKFDTACNQVRNFKKRPPDSDLLELYGLYKQSIVGDVNISKPSDSQGKAKWDAWNSKKGMDQNVSKEQYVAKAKALQSTYG